MMQVKFDVLGAGHTSFHSNKTNRDYQRVRLMGFVEDISGNKDAATADMGFDVALSEMPKSGDVVLLTITELTTRNAMTELTFSKLSPFVAASGSRELKR